jgi:hypothetical protein
MRVEKIYTRLGISPAERETAACSNWQLLIVFVFGATMTPPPAAAYGDLTNASYLSQAILSAIFGGTLLLKIVWSLFIDSINKNVRGE